VNVETKLSATLKRFDGQPINQSIKVVVQVQWGQQIPPCYLDVSTSKIYFTIKPTDTGTKSITFSSPDGLFETVTAYISCVPGIFAELVEPTTSSKQYIDPISHKDILLRVRARETSAGAYINSPSSWAVDDKNIKLPSLAPVGTKIYWSVRPTDVSGVYEIDCDISNDFQGTYTIPVIVTYSNYYPIVKNFTVEVKAPVIATKFTFETGQSVTIIPGINQGQEISLPLEKCNWFDIEFTDARGNPVSLQVGSIDVIIIPPAGGVEFSRTNGYVKVEQLANNKIRAYFTFVESWYTIELKSLTGGILLGDYPNPISLDQNYVHVATVTGFDPWSFITNPWFFVPASIIIFFLFIRLISRREKKIEE
jgi:hypothetical protein